MNSEGASPAFVFPNASALNTLTRAQWDALLAGPPERAATWLSAAAHAGHAEAQAVLGQWLLDGRGVARNETSAFAWFQRAAEQRHPMAANMLGRCFEHGWGTAPDPQRAASAYRASAELGLDWGMYNLANLLATGRGVALDHAAAFDWYRRAAALGHARSMNMLGRYHEDGLVVPRDRDRARALYRASAEAGDFRGRFSHASMLAEQGEIDAAVRWFERIPDTAPKHYLAEVVQRLRASPLAALREVADRLEAQAAARA